jgi:hypothetical protein
VKYERAEGQKVLPQLECGHKNEKEKKNVSLPHVEGRYGWDSNSINVRLHGFVSIQRHLRESQVKPYIIHEFICSPVTSFLQVPIFLAPPPLTSVSVFL